MIKDVDGLLSVVTADIREQMDVAVIGLSGGADSTLVALLCVEALGAENVHGVHMPFDDYDSETFNANSKRFALRLGIADSTVSIGPAVDALVESIPGMPLSRLNRGNMRSRMRMVALYSTCCQLGESAGKRVRVLGTGNLGEDLIGFDTKGGDALADYFPIGTLVKSEVYQLLDYFVTRGDITDDMIDRIPSAGLWAGHTDADELGYTYDEMEPYVLDIYEHGHAYDTSDDEIGQFVWNRHVANRHKHEAPPVSELREFCASGDRE